MAPRVGVDVGGTNTDAVLMDDQRVVASVKVPTTQDTTSGIAAALGGVASRNTVGRVDAVMIASSSKRSVTAPSSSRAAMSTTPGRSHPSTRVRSKPWRRQYVTPVSRQRR